MKFANFTPRRRTARECSMRANGSSAATMPRPHRSRRRGHASRAAAEPCSAGPQEVSSRWGTRGARWSWVHVGAPSRAVRLRRSRWTCPPTLAGRRVESAKWLLGYRARLAGSRRGLGRRGKMTLGTDAASRGWRCRPSRRSSSARAGCARSCRDFPGILRGAALCLCVLAIARPQNVLRGENAEERGIDIVIVLDLSGSMRALMDQPAHPTSPRAGGRTPGLTRLETAKQVILDFIAPPARTTASASSSSGRSPTSSRRPTLDKTLLAGSCSKMSARHHRRQRHRHRRRRRHRRRAPAAERRARRRPSSSSPTATRTPARSPPSTPRTSRRRRGCASTPCRSATATTSTSRTASTSSASPLPRAHFPVNPDAAKKMSSETGGESFVATDKTRPREEHARHPRPAREDPLRVAGREMEDLFPFLLVPAVLLIALEGLVRVLVTEVPVMFFATTSRALWRPARRACLRRGCCWLRGHARPGSRSRGRGPRGASGIPTWSSSSSRSDSTTRRAVKGVLLVLAMICAFLALARPAVPSRHAAHPGDQPRCGHRARLLEEHVRARHRAEPHRAREGRGRPPHPRSARARASAPSRSPASRCASRSRATAPRSRSSSAARAERHARRRHGHREALEAAASSSRAIPSRRTTCASSSS